MNSRREFISFIGLLGIGTMLPQRAWAMLEAGSLRAQKLTDDAWVILGGGGNVLLVRSDSGPIVVDAKSADAALELPAVIERHADRAPALLINTHHHADHVGGNYLFAKSAEIVAHQNVRPRLEETIESRIRPALEKRAEQLRSEGNLAAAEQIDTHLAELTAASIAADHEVETLLEITFGGVKIRLIYYENAHTDNDIVVQLPEMNIIHTGDLIFNELWPFIDRPARASIRGWQRTLWRISKLADPETVIVPGHGEIGESVLLNRQHRFFDDLRTIVEREMDAGTSRDEIVKLEPDAFSHFGHERLRPIAIGVMYDETKIERERTPLPNTH